MKTRKNSFAISYYCIGKILPALFILLCFFTFCPNILAYPRTPADLIETSCGEEHPEAKKILVAYDTIHGSTAQVAERIGQELCSQGFQVDVRLARHVQSIDAYDAVIIGSAIYKFNWLPDALGFMKKYQTILSDKPAAIFIVGASMSEDTPENRASVKESFVDPVLEKYPDVKPLSIGLFGGAVDFTRNEYTPFEKFVLRILGKVLGFTDTADWRNWEYISDWSQEVGDMVQ
jgi:menaquinone-dependent protoporphyrinogen oxidase